MSLGINYSEQRKEKSSQDSLLLVPTYQLPNDCLFIHSLRANYQAGVWRRALEECPSILNPCGHGWCYEDGKLKIWWMTG